MKTQPDALKSSDIKQDASSKTDDPVQDTLKVRKEEREKAHSLEMRNVAALEQIADELTALRVHLTGKA